MIRLTFVLIVTLVLVAPLAGCDQVEFPERPYPRVETLAVANMSETAVTFRGNLVWRGSEPITDHGFVWGTAADLSFSLSEKAQLGPRTTDGQFEANINLELAEGQTYYIRAFAITSDYIVYGKYLSFTSEGSD